MKMKRLLALSVTLSLVSGALAAAPPFTAAQATAGDKVYTANCQSCHGNKLQGGAGPALAGKAFLQKWSSHKLDDLYYIIHSQMPLSAPGSLSDTQYLDVTTFILQKNGAKPGKKSLTAAALKKTNVSVK